MLDGHVRGEDLLVTARHLQVAVTVVGREQITMPRILGHLEQPLDRDVGLGDVEMRHGKPLPPPAAKMGRAGGRVNDRAASTTTLAVTAAWTPESAPVWDFPKVGDLGEGHERVGAVAVEPQAVAVAATAGGDQRAV